MPGDKTQASVPISASASTQPPLEQSGEPFGQVGDRVFQTEQEFLDYQTEQNGGVPAGAPPVKKDGAADEDDAGDVAGDEDEGEDTPAPQEAPAKEAPKVEAPKVRTVDEIKASLKEAGGIFADPRYEAAAIEFETTGAVSDATKAKAAADFGVEPSVVDQFIQGQKDSRELATLKAATPATPTAAETKLIADIHGEVGGEEAYSKFQEWAAANLPKDQLKDFNAAIEHSPAGARALFKDMAAAYREAGNGSPRDITKEAGGSAPRERGPKGYANEAQMQADMNKPEYQTDPAFRDRVMARVGASKF